jgi:hypothetical protein
MGSGMAVWLSGGGPAKDTSGRWARWGRLLNGGKAEEKLRGGGAPVRQAGGGWGCEAGWGGVGGR